jgi:hypothetical protein
MYFLCFTPTDGDQDTLLTIVRKFQKNVKKHYEVLEFRRMERPLTSPDLAVEIGRLYRSPDFKITKRLYSQDRRPSRRIVAPARVIFDFSEIGIGPVDHLRKNKIAVEAIALTPESIWRKEEFGRALGHNYYVPMAMVFDTLKAVHSQGRLHATQGLNTDLLEQEAEFSVKNPVGWPIEHVTGIGFPVWFRETIRYKRAYST